MKVVKILILLVVVFIGFLSAEYVLALSVGSNDVWLDQQQESSSSFNCVDQVGSIYSIIGRAHKGDEDDPSAVKCGKVQIGSMAGIPLNMVNPKEIFCEDNSSCSLVCPDQNSFMIGRKHYGDEDEGTTIVCASADQSNYVLDQCVWSGYITENDHRYQCPSEKPFMRGYSHAGDEDDGTEYYCCNSSYTGPKCGAYNRTDSILSESGWPNGTSNNMFCSTGTVGVMTNDGTNGIPQSYSWGDLPTYSNNAVWYCKEDSNMSSDLFVRCEYNVVQNDAKCGTVATTYKIGEDFPGSGKEFCSVGSMDRNIQDVITEFESNGLTNWNCSENSSVVQCSADRTKPGAVDLKTMCIDEDGFGANCKDIEDKDTPLVGTIEKFVIGAIGDTTRTGSFTFYKDLDSSNNPVPICSIDVDITSSDENNPTIVTCTLDESQFIVNDTEPVMCFEYKVSAKYKPLP